VQRIKTFEHYAIVESLSNDLLHLKSLFEPNRDLFLLLADGYYGSYADYVTDTNAGGNDWYYDKMYYYDPEPADYVSNLEEADRLAFGEWLYNEWSNNTSKMEDIYGRNMPLFAAAGFEGIVRNEWMVHLSNHAVAIAENGFSGGVINPLKLAYTETAGDIDRDGYGGWFFAYPADHAAGYGLDRYGHTTYGDGIVMFMGSGLEIYHYNDDELQIIFNGNHTRYRVLIMGDGRNWHVINSNDNTKIYTSDYLGDVIEWVQENFDQYKRIISYT